MNIVSSADTSFFHCAVELAKSVRKFYGKQLILYDVGLTEQERINIDAKIIPINVPVAFSSYAVLEKGAFIQATHKPFCIRHYFEHYSEPLLFVDADCLFTKRVEEKGFDVGVTLRSNRVNKADPAAGLLNTGVVFFNTPAQILLERWIIECGKENTTDQKALSEILSEGIDWKHYNKVYQWNGLSIKVFGTDEFNDYHFKKGKIFHFKGRRHDKNIYARLIQAYHNGENIYDLFLKLTGKKKTTRKKVISFFTDFKRSFVSRLDL